MTNFVHLFAYFTHNGQHGMRLASSRDGLTWEDIPGTGYVIVPEEGLMRDPFLLRAIDKTYHLIWTTDWESKDIGYASSKDLVNWSPQRRIPVMAKHPSVRNCWAPEMVFDPKIKKYRIYWASTVPALYPEDSSSSESGYNHRMWSVTTTDFENISEPEVFFDPGFNVIDITLHQTPDGQIRLIGKDERLDPEKKDLFFCEAKSHGGPFSPPSDPFTDSWVEGPACLQIGEWTHVYYDVYREKRYEAKRTKNFKRWEDISDRLSFPKGARHGSMLTLSKTEFDHLFPKEK
ncbi:glycoside hydrolase family 43 protein [Pelagicoccus albus]|uniref:Glycoside hydrolase family 43 protein n=1 Tax=Pelagicoccus albus TaxID=415222 RepID=A0A7X1E6S5_9BACT|nr:glycoside hydrolase family 43 protein [Pelagicoccus albus]MBC2605015.1 glycoside hydrolase family 43 protein [Pelagicoccus albus]